MASLYAAADLVLNPSRADNTPNSIIESLACAVPVVSTNVGGIPFLVENESTALLVPPDDPIAMSQAIVRMIDDLPLRQACVANGLMLAERMSWPSVKQSWLSAYQSARGQGDVAVK